MRNPFHTFLLGCAAAILIGSLGFAEEPDDPHALGRKLYAQSCASCHGDRGEGTDHYPSELTGDRSVPELAEIITKTMPEDEPDICVGDDAKAVAAFIHAEFYSPVARARNAPARVALSRLTVTQHRNALTDLVNSFGGWGNRGEERGLRGDYRLKNNKGKRLPKLNRVDAAIDFDFGENGPTPETVAAQGFGIWWSGSIIVDETGLHEFVIESPNGVRLYVNDVDTPLIDAKVRSGNDTVKRATIFLLAGRAYPMRIDFNRAKKDKTANLELRWKTPSLAEAVIPSRNLTPNDHSIAFVPATSFPPDDFSTGYIRGSSVSKEWHQAAVWSAVETSEYVITHLDRLAKTKPDANDRETKLKEFASQFVERAFRRPLTETERTVHIERQFAEADNPETAIKRIVILSLVSPNFLYRENPNEAFDPYDTASWLSFSLWDSIPDDRLLNAAASDRLNTPDQLDSEIRRMLADPRATTKLTEFLRRWLGMDRLHDLSKDADAYPNFDEHLASDLRTSLELTLERSLNSDPPRLDSLLTSDEVFLNQRLAEFYGVTLPKADGERAAGEFVPVPLEPDQRSGVLTHPYLLSGLAYYGTSSPIHRGVFLSRHVLGRTLKPPPVAVSPLAPDLHPDLTTRERVTLQTSAATCMTCHGMINSLGFALERFDAVGRFREKEHDRTIDATGSYWTRSGSEEKFEGADALGEFLIGSDEVREAFVEQLFQSLTGHPVQAFDHDLLPELVTGMRSSGGDFREATVHILRETVLEQQKPDE